MKALVPGDLLAAEGFSSATVLEASGVTRTHKRRMFGRDRSRGAAPISELDRLLGAAPLAGGLIRCPVPGDHCLERVGGELVRRPVLAAEPCPSLEGLGVRRVTAVGAGAPVDDDAWSTAWPAWLAASTGYLAGLGEAALDLTVDYVRNRAAFGATLGALAPVQQLLAGAATAVRGVALLCADGPGEDALRHAGPAVRGACDACHQVSGAIGYTLEYPLHRYSQRARALATWNDALLDAIAGCTPQRSVAARALPVGAHRFSGLPVVCRY